MIFVPSFASHGKIPASSPLALSWIPYIFGTDGPVTSASRIPTANPCSRIIRASDAVTIDLPTPPLPLTTAITFLICENAFAGCLISSGLLLHVPAWAHPAQSDDVQPFCCCSSAIIPASFDLTRSPPQSIQSHTSHSSAESLPPRSFSPAWM